VPQCLLPAPEVLILHKHSCITRCECVDRTAEKVSVTCFKDFQPNKSSIDICIDAFSFLWVDSNGLEEHAASNFKCEELTHIINDGSLHYKISTL